MIYLACDQGKENPKPEGEKHYEDCGHHEVGQRILRHYAAGMQRSARMGKNQEGR